MSKKIETLDEMYMEVINFAEMLRSDYYYSKEREQTWYNQEKLLKNLIDDFEDIENFAKENAAF